MITKQCTPTTKEHMLSVGFNPRKKSDKLLYAKQLEQGLLCEPRQLRGTKRDSLTGYYWSRKEAYISKHYYGIDLSYVAQVLSGLKSDIGFCILNFSNKPPNLTRYLVSLPGSVGSAYVSVFTSEKGLMKIIKAVPVDCGFSLS